MIIKHLGTKIQMGLNVATTDKKEKYVWQIIYTTDIPKDPQGHF